LFGSNCDPVTTLENSAPRWSTSRRVPAPAEAAADALPAPASARQRVLFGRIQSLATKTSQQASASLRFVNAQVTALEAQMEARRQAAAR
jgi:hypothetical protein